MKVKFTTSKGDMVAELFKDATPKTVANFTKLISEGFYEELKFHRVIPNFMVQGGCPQGTGLGSAGHTIMCEHQGAANQTHDRGTLSMARSSDPDSANSQFFICFKPAPFLDRQYTVFGKVLEGMEFVDKIKRGDDSNNGAVSDPDKIISFKSL